MIVWKSWIQISRHAFPWLISLIQLTFIDFAQLCIFSNEQGAIVNGSSWLDTTFLSHTDLILETFCQLNFDFLVIGPSTLTNQYIGLTKSQLTSSGWPLLKLLIVRSCCMICSDYGMIRLKIAQFTQFCPESIYWITKNMYWCEQGVRTPWRENLNFHHFGARNVEMAMLHSQFDFSASHPIEQYRRVEAFAHCH